MSPREERKMETYIYCGYLTGDVPSLEEMDSLIDAHMRTCQKHPMATERRAREAAEIAALKREVERLKDIELEHSDCELGQQLQQDAVRRATKRWHEAGGKRNVLPDLADLILWLLHETEAAEGKLRALRECLCAEGQCRQCCDPIRAALGQEEGK